MHRGNKVFEFGALKGMLKEAAKRCVIGRLYQQQIRYWNKKSCCLRRNAEQAPSCRKMVSALSLWIVLLQWKCCTVLQCM